MTVGLQHFECIRLSYKSLILEETDDEYNGEVGKRVLVWTPKWRNERVCTFATIFDNVLYN